MPHGAAWPASDTDLLKACQARDPVAAKELVRRLEPQLLRVARRLVGRRDIAEEIVQEAFLHTFREIDRIDGRGSPRGWVLGTVVNLVRNHSRKHSKAEISDNVDTEAPALFGVGPRDPADAASTSELRRCVERALDQLSPKLREITLLHFAEGFTFAELASVLRAPAPVLRMRALRARAQLRGLLGDFAP